MTQVLAVAKGGVVKTTTMHSPGAAPEVEVVATMYDRRTRLTQAKLADLGGAAGLPMPRPAIPKSVRVAPAPGRACSVLGYSPTSPSGAAYRALAARIDPSCEGIGS